MIRFSRKVAVSSVFFFVNSSVSAYFRFFNYFCNEFQRISSLGLVFRIEQAASELTASMLSALSAFTEQNNTKTPFMLKTFSSILIACSALAPLTTAAETIAADTLCAAESFPRNETDVHSHTPSNNSHSTGNMWQRAAKGIQYRATAQVNAADGMAPLWLTSNRYGLSSVDGSNGYLRVALERSVMRDSLSKWRLGYGADVAVAYNFTSTAVVQQLYADFDYKLVRLTIGAKEQPMEFKNQELSSGSQTLGINARPIPQVRIGLPEYWNISGRGNWAAIKGHIGYGMMTDGRFQRDYLTSPGAQYARKVLFHSKAGYLRLGNEEKFPITFEGGLEMACQFAGTIHYKPNADGTQRAPEKMPHGFRDFIDATLGIGGDPSDGIYANATGNTVGSWLFRLNYKGKNWRVSAYLDHYFEDHSQMFWEYGWRDGLYGIDITLPRNRFVSSVVYEYLKTTYQSGALYHDHTPGLADQISGSDSYYNHGIYGGWRHWGMAIGNPLYVSPLYKNNGTLNFIGTRFKAHHLGLSGDPLPSLHYRLLYSHERNLGNYGSTSLAALTNHSMLAEVHFSPERLGRLNTRGWTAGLAIALDRGDLVGNNFGAQLTLGYSGLFGK